MILSPEQYSLNGYTKYYKYIQTTHRETEINSLFHTLMTCSCIEHLNLQNDSFPTTG